MAFKMKSGESDKQISTIEEAFKIRELSSKLAPYRESKRGSSSTRNT